jgi:hypothetical protein
VVFRDGAYDPQRCDGQRLIAHEVAHTVQARGVAASACSEAKLSEPGDALEREADAFADEFVRATRVDRASRSGHAPERAADDVAGTLHPDDRAHVNLGARTGATPLVLRQEYPREECPSHGAVPPRPAVHSRAPRRRFSIATRGGPGSVRTSSARCPLKARWLARRC